MESLISDWTILLFFIRLGSWFACIQPTYTSFYRFHRTGTWINRMTSPTLFYPYYLYVKEYVNTNKWDDYPFLQMSSKRFVWKCTTRSILFRRSNPTSRYRSYFRQRRGFRIEDGWKWSLAHLIPCLSAKIQVVYSISFEESFRWTECFRKCLWNVLSQRTE